LPDSDGSPPTSPTRSPPARAPVAPSSSTVAVAPISTPAQPTSPLGPIASYHDAIHG
uniref:Serine/threonine protein kinase n=1 Tax=Heligmosomoides polygyrus TaxID=6339 RepID=A0A183GUP4_HELPZ